MRKIRDTARNIIKKIKDNKPVTDELFIYDNVTSNIFDAVIQECKSMIMDNNGNYMIYGSTIPQNHVKRIVRSYISNMPEISPDIVSQAYTSDGIPGPYLPMGYTKYFDEKGKISVGVENLGVDIRNNELDDDEVLDKYLYEPLAKLYIDSDNNVDKRVKRKNKFSKKRTIDEIEETLTRKLTESAKKRGIDISRIPNISGWLVRSMGSNPTFMRKVTQMRDVMDEKSEKKYGQVLATMKESILSEVLNRIYEINGKVPNQIINDANSQFEALGLDIDDMSKEEIIANIKEINAGTIKGDNNIYTHIDSTTGFRDCEVGLNKEGKGTRFLAAKDIPTAMESLATAIKELTDNADSMTDVEYIREVARIKYRFIRIHPFPDGNGRTSRAITNILMSKKDSVVSFDKTEKKDYTYIMERANVKLGQSQDSAYMLLLKNGDVDACRQQEDEALEELSSYIASKHFKYKQDCPETDGQETNTKVRNANVKTEDKGVEVV